MSIEVSTNINYGYLQKMVKNWLNRSDLVIDGDDQIKDFIALGERKIFRQLRSPLNEMLWLPPAPIIETSYITLPADLLEIKDLDIGGVVYRFKPYNIWLENKSGCATYTRVASNLYVRPNVAIGAKIKLIYYWDATGLNANADTNNVLRTCPDLYLYASLIQAESFLINDERIALWKELYDATLDELNRGLRNVDYRGNLVIMER